MQEVNGSIPFSSTIHKGPDNLRALFFVCDPRTTRGSGHLCCGWPSAETLEIGHFLGQSRLCSPFGLRVGADGALAKSTTYARRFTVNQGRQSGIEPATLVKWKLIRYHSPRELPDQRTPAGRWRQPLRIVVRVAGCRCRRQGARSRQPDGTGQPVQR